MDDELLETSALLAIGELRAEELPDIATQALVRGVDSPSLRILAGLCPGDVRESRDAFERAMAEFGVEAMAPEDARWFLAYRKLRAAVAGHLAPAEVASWIWANVYNDVVLEGDLRIFVGLASELQDHPADRAAIEARIIDEAQDFLGRPAPRRWLLLQALPAEGPLWTNLPWGRTLVPIDDLPLPAELGQAVAVWFADYQGTVGAGESYGFATQDDAVAFVARGKDLVRRLQGALGTGWHVEYMSEPIRPPGLRLRKGLAQ